MKKPLPVRTQIRLPAELHARLVTAAEVNESSMNDAMVYYIERGMQSEAPALSSTGQEIVNAVQAAIDASMDDFRRKIKEDAAEIVANQPNKKPTV